MITRDITVDNIMEKAQEFASAWALVDSRFDRGDMLEEAERLKEELRDMVSKAFVIDKS